VAGPQILTQEILTYGIGNPGEVPVLTDTGLTLDGVQVLRLQFQPTALTVTGTPFVGASPTWMPSGALIWGAREVVMNGDPDNPQLVTYQGDAVMTTRTA
jgi:hypothetical protein